MVRDEIRERFGVADEKLHVIYNAVDPEIFNPSLRNERLALREKYGIADESVLFLLVGSGYRAQERRDRAARACRAAIDHAPDGRRTRQAADYYVSHRTRPRGPDRVTFAGRTSIRARSSAPRMRSCCPRCTTRFPNAALEAMACGMPVITSTKSGAAELVREHDAGLVCPSRDIAGLAAHMRILLDPLLRERMGANARRAVADLTPAAMTLKLVLLYKQLLEASVAKRQARKRETMPPAPAFAEPPRETMPTVGPTVPHVAKPAAAPTGQTAGAASAMTIEGAASDVARVEQATTSGLEPTVMHEPAAAPSEPSAGPKADEPDASLPLAAEPAKPDDPTPARDGTPPHER